MNAKLLLLGLLSLFSTSMAADLKVGVIDEEKVIENYERSGKLLTSLENQIRAKEEEIKGLENDIKNAEREFLTAGPQKKEEILQKVTRNKIEIEVQKKMVKELFNSQRERYRILVVEDIREAIKVIGGDEGYDLILRKEVPGPRGMEPSVYFSKESLDVTNAVLKYLNAKFRQESQNQVEK